MSNLNKWDSWYKNLKKQEPYGNTKTYKLGADFLSDCATVEDWGCGKGWFRLHLPKKINYIGLDGTYNKFVDSHVDLENYRSESEGIFLRHVLEHNYNWEKILVNAVNSFKKKMVLVIFTPWSDTETKQIGFTDALKVPDISFKKEDITKHLKDFSYRQESLASKETFYAQEHIFFISK